MTRARRPRPRRSSTPPASSSTTSTTSRATRLDEGCHLVFIGDPEHREVVGYTHDLDAEQLPHRVDPRRTPRAVDWASYAAHQDLLPDHPQRRRLRGAWCATSRRPTRNTIARRHHLLRHQGEPGRGARSRRGSRGRAGAGDRRHAIGQHPPPVGDHLRGRAVATCIQGPATSASEWFEGVSCVGLTAGASTPDTSSTRSRPT